MAPPSEIHPFLRLRFVKRGVQHGPEWEGTIEPQSVEAVVAGIMKEQRGRTIAVLAPLAVWAIVAGEYRMALTRVLAAAATDGLEGFADALKEAFAAQGPALVHVRIRPGSMEKLGRPTVKPADVARRFRAFLAGKSP